MKSIAEEMFIAGKGIDGDRSFTCKGQLSFVTKDADHEFMLIQSEQACYFNTEKGAVLPVSLFRRNIATSGVDLNEFVGKEFKLGEATLHRMCLYEPCKYLARAVDSRVVPLLVHRGSLRAGNARRGIVQSGDAFLVI